MDLDAIEKRARAATEGPWHAAVNDLVGGWCVNLQDVPLSQSPHCGIADFVRHEDAQFIAHARTDVPALVARVKELEEENARLRAGLDAATGFDFGDVEVRRHIDRWAVDSGPLELYDTLDSALERARQRDITKEDT